MFSKIKLSKKQQKDNTYISFDDFIQMMINCSDEQFISTFNWFKSMRETNLQ